MGEISANQESKAAGNDSRSEMIFSRLIYVCIAITAGISGIAIVGWMLDRLILAGISTNYIPMALSTALLFIVLCGALIAYSRQTASTHVRMIAKIGVFLVILISLIIFIDFFTGVTLDIEQILQPHPEKFEGVPINRMSPITAANFLLAGSALLLLLASLTGGQRARGVAAFLATLVICSGFVLLLGYLYGTPLLYGGYIIPVALNTAILFVFLGFAIMLAAGQHYWPMRSFMGSSVSARLLRVFLPLTIAPVLIVSFLVEVIFKNVGDYVLVSSLATILAMIILGIIIPKISNAIGSDLDRANLEKERAIESLRKSEEQFQSVAQTANDAIITSDSNGIIVLWNHGAEKIFGYSVYEITGKSLTFIMPERYREPHKNALSRVVSTGKNSLFGKTVELSALRKDGSEFPIELSLSSWKTKDGVFLSGIIRDITERRRTEEELKKHREHLEELVNERTSEVMLAKEEAEHANMAKANFLNTMSHELRTPLNAILGFSELLKGKTSGELNEKQERFLDNIQTGGNNLLGIITQILDFVRMDEGTFELRIEKFPVPETIDEIISVIKEKASKKNVVLEKTIDPKLTHIEADKQKLMQILIHLLDNGLKFSKPEGGNVTLTAQKEGDMAKFSVSDTGIGIKEEEMVHLFEKFTQLDPGLNRRYGGTGIGLAIVKQIVELHGGKICAHSKFGEGSTFVFLIPLKARNEMKIANNI